MQCHEFHNRLQDWLDGESSAAEADRLQTHAATCPACRARADEFRALRRALAALPAPALSAEQGERMLARARPRRRAWPMMAASAAAAAVLTAALLVPFADRDPATPSGAERAAPTAEIQVPLNRIRTVRLALSSRRTLENATVVLELPSEVTLQDRPEQRVLRWQTDIAAGNNRLSLPLIAHEAGVRELVARIEHGGKSQEMRIRLNTQESTSSPNRGELQSGPDPHLT
jgi:hypothetical protein